MLILRQGLWHWRLSQTPLWGLALLLPPKAVLGIGSGVTTTCLMGVLPQGHPCSRVPSPVSQLQQQRQSILHAPDAIQQDRQSLAAPSQPPQKLLTLMPLPAPRTFQRRLMTYFLSSTWDLSRRLQRLAFSARLLSQGCCRHWSALIRALGARGACVNPA